MSVASENLTLHSMNSTTENIFNTPKAGWLTMTALAFMIAVTVISNGVIIICFIENHRRLLHEPFNLYLLNLAVSDFIAGSIAMPHYAASTYFGYWPFGYRQCTFFTYFDNLSTSESLMGLAVTALDRLWAVSAPVSYREHNSCRKVTVVIILTWIYTNLGFGPGMFYNRMYSNVTNPYVCSWEISAEPEWTSSLYGLIFTMWVPTILAVLAYVLTLAMFGRMTCRRHHQIHAAAVAERVTVRGLVKMNSKERRYRKERKVFILLTLLFVSLIICWSTPWTYLVLAFSYGYDNPQFYVATYWLAYLMSTLNPFLFHIGSDDIRTSVRKLFIRNSQHGPVSDIPSRHSNSRTLTLTQNVDISLHSIGGDAPNRSICDQY